MKSARKKKAKNEKATSNTQRKKQSSGQGFAAGWRRALKYQRHGSWTTNSKLGKGKKEKKPREKDLSPTAKGALSKLFRHCEQRRAGQGRSLASNGDALIGARGKEGGARDCPGMGVLGSVRNE